jgi:hypothetical protein
VQKAGKSTEPVKPVQRAPAAGRGPSEPAKARRMARQAGEQEAQRLKTAEPPKQPQKLSVAPENDAHEKQAQQVASRVGAGEKIEPGGITPVAPDRDRERQRAAKSAGEPEAKAVQKASKGGKPEEKPQRLPAPGGRTASELDRAAEKAVAGKRAGEPMQPATRNILESRMGVGLGDVRVHEDEGARRDAAALEARAFTLGHDIWLGPGESQSDIGLMAHEATHVVQQAGGVSGGVVQREEEASTDEWDYEGPRGKIKKNKRISIPLLRVPGFKKDFIQGPLTLKKKGKDTERTDEQRAIWEKKAAEGMADKITAKLAENTKATPMQKDGKPISFLKLKSDTFYVIGTPKDIEGRVLRPFWDKNAKKHPFHVDHKLEVQLTPADWGDKQVDDLSNLWLLDAKANMASGQNIKLEKNAKIQNLLDAATEKPKKGAKKEKEDAAATDAPPDKSAPIFTKDQDLETVRQKYEITFEKVQKGLEPATIEDQDSWTMEEINAKALQLAKLKVLTDDEILKSGLQGSPTELAIYTNQTGGGLRRIKDWPEGTPSKKVMVGYGKSFRADEVTYNPTSRTGTLSGFAYENNKIIKGTDRITLDILPMDGVTFGGYISQAKVSAEVAKVLEIPGASPVVMSYIELTDRGFEGRGQLLPTVPLIKDIGIDVVLDGDDVYLSKTFTADEFKFPGPIQVTSASLEIFAGTIGIGARGTVAFEIERVGKGRLTANATMKDGFAIAGDFDFDSELFDPASVHVEYSHNTFSGHGELGIPEGKVNGIKSASLKVAFEGEKIDATGTVKPSMPGIEQGDMAFHYAPDTGIVISGTLALKKDIPGLAGGSVSAELAKRTGEDRWRVKASGEATPAIPGVTSKLAVTYDDGAFDAVATAGYEKGMLKGSITLGATNRTVGEDGKPGAKPEAGADKVTIYGGGSLTLRLAPWLQATALVRILPNGEIEVAGEIGLPSSLDIFPAKRFDKNIFKIGLDIPIVGVAVAGQRIGIFANITGGLDLSAGIGPGQLQDLHLKVTYNPAHEDQTHIEGGAKLHIPADAGLRLFVRGGLGVGIPIVSAQAGLEIGGQLGLAGAVDAAVAVDWMPSRGLQIDAEGSVYVQPKFVFDITGFVLVEADLWITTIELYSKKWKFASMEYGSGLKFGVKFPIRYREGQPFDISLSDVTFDVPQVEPGALLKGLVSQIV